jgi:hypothetical protein
MEINHMESVIELLRKMNSDLNLNLEEQINEIEKRYNTNFTSVLDISSSSNLIDIFINSITENDKPKIIKWLKEDSLKYGILLSMIY